MKNKQRKSKTNKDFLAAPDAATVKYSGPIPTRTSENGIVSILRDEIEYNTGSGTSFVSILDNNPSGADNWSEYSTAWAEYRVLAIKLEYVPQYVVNTTNIASAPLVHSVLHTSTITSPTGYSTALSIGDAKLGNTMTRFTREWRMQGVDEATWITTTAPAASSLAFTSSAFNATTGVLYGIGLITYLVQFRTTVQ
jgi:hypothetical protein